MQTLATINKVYHALRKKGFDKGRAAILAKTPMGESLAMLPKKGHVAMAGPLFTRVGPPPPPPRPTNAARESGHAAADRFNAQSDRASMAKYSHVGPDIVAPKGGTVGPKPPLPPGKPKAPAGQIAMADDLAMAGPSSKRTSECLAAANKDRAPAFTPTEKLTGRQLAYGVRHADRSASRTSGQGKRYERHRSNADRLADEGKKRGMPMDELTLVPRGKQPDAPVAMSDEPTNEEMIQPSSERVTPSPGHAILNDLRRGREAREKEQTTGPSGAKSSPSDVSRPAWQYLPDTDTGDQPSRSDYRNAGFRMLPRQPDSIHE